MSLYAEAMAAIRSMILIDERVQSMTRKVDKLADEVRAISERLVRLETIVEIGRADGSVLRVAGPERHGQQEKPE